MRDLKFRVRVECGCGHNGYDLYMWKSGEFRLYASSCCECSEGQIKKQHDPEQYTGLLDKDRKALDWWEGDILVYYGEVGSVIFQEGAFWFSPKDRPDEWEPLHEVAESYRVEKVGTIHTHPELL